MTNRHRTGGTNTPTTGEFDEPCVLVPRVLFDLVADRHLSPRAAMLYVAITARIGNAPGGRLTRAELGRCLGLAKADSVDRYLDELRQLGLVTWTPPQRGELRIANLYRVHLPWERATPERVG